MRIDPFDDEVEIEEEIAFAILRLDKSKRMNVIVVPRHRVELRLRPSVRAHGVVRPNAQANRRAAPMLTEKQAACRPVRLSAMLGGMV